METLFIKPARPGLLVRDPISREPLPDTGAEKPRDTHWLRRLREGDVVECDPPAPIPAQAEVSAGPSQGDSPEEAAADPAPDKYPKAKK